MELLLQNIFAKLRRVPLGLLLWFCNRLWPDTVEGGFRPWSLRRSPPRPSPASAAVPEKPSDPREEIYPDPWPLSAANPLQTKPELPDLPPYQAKTYPDPPGFSPKLLEELQRKLDPDMLEVHGALKSCGSGFREGKVQGFAGGRAGETLDSPELRERLRVATLGAWQSPDLQASRDLMESLSLENRDHYHRGFIWGWSLGLQLGALVGHGPSEEPSDLRLLEGLRHFSGPHMGFHRGPQSIWPPGWCRGRLTLGTCPEEDLYRPDPLERVLLLGSSPQNWADWDTIWEDRKTASLQILVMAGCVSVEQSLRVSELLECFREARQRSLEQFRSRWKEDLGGAAQRRA